MTQSHPSLPSRQASAPPCNSAPDMDEAARRAAHASLNADATKLLAAIADKLTAYRPTDRMLEQTRLALACSFATRLYGFTETADDLERVLQRRMPRVERERHITRGEYALVLRAAESGAGR